MPRFLLSRDERGRVTIGTLMTHEQIWREIKLKEHLDSRGRDSDINLQRLADASKMTGQLRCYQVNNSWLLTHRTHHTFDSWHNRAHRLLLSPPHRELTYRLNDLVARIEPRLTIRSHRDQVLHVPFDMTCPIEEQWTRLRPYLVETRKYLYRYTTKTPPRDKSRTAWRDIYIYLLAKVEGWNARRIGAEVFPSEQKRSRQLKVAQIIRTVHRAAKAVGFLDDTDVKKLSPPA